MKFGYEGLIGCVNLSTGKVEIRTPDDEFYRLYVGGGLMGSYYLLSMMPPGVDALSPESVVVFSVGPLTGVPFSGSSRFCVIAKSPLGGAIGESQAGGDWGAELKYAGFDAIVITGKAESPVYLWVCDGNIEIKNGSLLWGKECDETQLMVKKELKEQRACVACIGPAGENQVRFACIVNGNRHFNGRCGMGAVMGSKNLKAIAVRGHGTVNIKDKKSVNEIAKLAKKLIGDNGVMQLLSERGTNSFMIPLSEEGSLPTRNFTKGEFAGAKDISVDRLEELGIIKGFKTCRACVVKCKRSLENDPLHELDDSYGGPEYESAASLGAYLEVSDPYVISEANELCSRYGMDSISTGATIAFAMECFENGIISESQSDGLKLNFGNEEVVLPLIKKIAYRKGIGNLLAEGTKRASAILGASAAKYAMQVKGVEFPAHLPHGKQSLAIAYATIPFGPDHGSSEHDGLIAPTATSLFKERAQAIGLTKSAEGWVLNKEKSRFFALSQQFFSAIETFSVCHFCCALAYLYSPDNLVNLVNAVTDWDINLSDLLTIGERRINMLRSFNAREGFDKHEDVLPKRFFEPLGGKGPNARRKIDRVRFRAALNKYYQIMGWNLKTGNPTRSKLKDLGVEWVADELYNWGKLPEID